MTFTLVVKIGLFEKWERMQFVFEPLTLQTADFQTTIMDGYIVTAIQSKQCKSSEHCYKAERLVGAGSGP